MSAAAARRKKQLAARKAAAAEAAANNQDVVSQQLSKLLEAPGDGEIDESTAYEALQLAQSQVRKKEHAGEYAQACDLAYTTSLALLKNARVSVASQLLTVLVQVLRETHTEETESWLDRLSELQQAHTKAMNKTVESVEKMEEKGGDGHEDSAAAAMQEVMRLHRLQRDWLRACLQWSSELGKVKLGHYRLHALLGEQCWKLATLEVEELGLEDTSAAENAAHAADYDDIDEEILDWQCDAVQHMALAEQPLRILEWLKTLPKPTQKEIAAGHDCPPAARDSLLTRSLILFCALENLRDANILLRGYINSIEERKIEDLVASYTNKEDGMAPSHVAFGCMLLRTCEKDARTAKLYQWLLRSFKRELDRMYKHQVVMGYTTKIGKTYFNIQPPPSMLNMVENMMGMMGGGGGGMGGLGGMDPAMMQAAMAQMQQGGMM